MGMRLIRPIVSVCLVAAVCVWLAMWLGSVDYENHHRLADGVGEQVVGLRLCLQHFKSEHNRPIRSLAEIVRTSHAQQHCIEFSTVQQLPCRLAFVRRNYITEPRIIVSCGEPLLAELEISADGTVLHEEWYPYSRLQTIFCRRVDQPTLISMLRHKPIESVGVD